MSTKTINYTINFENCDSHSDIIEKFNFLYYIKKNSYIHLTIDFAVFKKFIYPDYALIILYYIIYFKNYFENFKGQIINLKKSDPSYNYLERMNFFYVLGNGFMRYKSKESNDKSFLEFVKYNEDTSDQIIQKIVTIIAKKINHIEKNVLISLSYCLGEILDNINNYTTDKSGYVVCQYFKQTNKIRLMIADKGDGIINTLKFNNITQQPFENGDALEYCIQDKITSGKGQGHGLFATATFIEENLGDLTIHSCNYKLNFNSFTKKTLENNAPLWKGTIVFLNINTNQDVDYRKFTSKSFDEGKDVFDERFPEINDILLSKGISYDIAKKINEDKLW